MGNCPFASPLNAPLIVLQELTFSEVRTIPLARTLFALYRRKKNFYFREQNLQSFADFWRPIVILDGSLWYKKNPF
jgi:hypothetical protein